jgi:nucleotide-binding universal stress UspA family protein
MIETHRGEVRSHLVVVVGVDLSDVSEHVLARAADLIRSIDDAKLHVVHVIQPQPLRHLMVKTARATEGETLTFVEAARQKLHVYCETAVPRSGERVVLHTPVGHPAEELTRIARETGADIIVVEVHEHPPRMFHHSVVARIAQTAPCSVLALRDPSRAGRAPSIAAASL